LDVCAVVNTNGYTPKSVGQLTVVKDDALDATVAEPAKKKPYSPVFKVM